MIPYSIIIPSASRPHLLQPTVDSLLKHIDQLPKDFIVHDDAAFDVSYDTMERIVASTWSLDYVSLFWHRKPPIGHGPALHWLLNTVQTEYVLYSQDDHVVERMLPIQETLRVMEEYNLHQVRFNKRQTMDKKETTTGTFYKKEIDFGGTTLCVSDHWYFQTSLWRVSFIKPIVDWFMAHEYEGPWFHEKCEDKINRAIDGFIEGFPPELNNHMNFEGSHVPSIRARKARTFIYGPVNEPKFITHIGNKPEDWALPQPRTK